MTGTANRIKGYTNQWHSYLEKVKFSSSDTGTALGKMGMLTPRMIFLIEKDDP